MAQLQRPRIVAYNQTILTNDGQSVRPIMPFLKAGGTHMIICTLHIHPNNFDQLWLNDNPYDEAIFDDLWTQVAEFQKAGGVVTAMIGGAAGGGISMMEFDQNKDKYFDLVCKFLREKKMQGLDLDIESGDNSCDNANTLLLIQRFRQVFGPKFIITMAPMATDLTSTSGSTFSQINYPTLYKQSVDAKCPIDWFNLQFYNTFYTLDSPDAYNKIIAYGKSTKMFTAAQIVAGAETTGNISYNTLKQTVQSLAAAYNTKDNLFGGVMGWEYFNSDPGGESAPENWTKGLRDTIDAAQAKPIAYVPLARRLPAVNWRGDYYRHAIVLAVLVNVYAMWEEKYYPRKGVQSASARKHNMYNSNCWRGPAQLVVLHDDNVTFYPIRVACNATLSFPIDLSLFLYELTTTAAPFTSDCHQEEQPQHLNNLSASGGAKKTPASPRNESSKEETKLPPIKNSPRPSKKENAPRSEDFQDKTKDEIIKQYIQLKAEHDELRDDYETMGFEKDGLEDTIQQLKEDMQRSGSGTQASELRTLRMEKAKTERENEHLKKQNEKLSVSLKVEREKSQKNSDRLNEESTKVNELENELEGLKAELREDRKANQQSKARLTQQTAEESDYKTKLQEKNKAIEGYLEEIKLLSRRNRELTSEVEILHEDLEAVVEEAELGHSRYDENRTKLADLIESKSILEDERQDLTQQVQTLRSELEARDALHEKIVLEMESKIKQWRDALDERDRVIEDKEDQIESYENLLSMRDKNKTINIEVVEDTIDGLRKALAEKESNILLLQDNIESLNRDYEELCVELLNTEDRGDATVRKAFKGNRTQINKLKEEIQSLRKQVERNKKDEKSSNASLQESQEVVAELRERMALYEAKYGLEDAVKEMRELRSKLKMKETQLREANYDISTKLEHIEKLYNEVVILRKKCNLPNGVTEEELEEYQLREKLETQQIRSMNRQYEEEITELEEERMKMKAALRYQALSDAERALQMGMTLEDYKASQKRSEGTIRVDDDFSGGVSSVKAQKHIAALKTELQEAKRATRLAEMDAAAAREAQRHMLSQGDVKDLMQQHQKLNAQLVESNNIIAELRTSKPREIIVTKPRRIPFPKDLSIAGHEDLQYLNEQLLEFMEEVEQLRKVNAGLEERIQYYGEQYAILQGQQRLLYREHHQLMEKSEKESDRHNKEMGEALQSAGDKKLQFDIYEATKNSNLDDAVKDLAVCRYEVAVAKRKLDASDQEIFILKKAKGHLEKDMSEMEAILKERLITLEAYRETSQARTHAFHEKLSRSVPAAQLSESQK
ncbi:centrosomal protein, partial [Planoprotostelium fungivorum]